MGSRDWTTAVSEQRVTFVANASSIGHEGDSDRAGSDHKTIKITDEATAFSCYYRRRITSTYLTEQRLFLERNGVGTNGLNRAQTWSLAARRACRSFQNSLRLITFWLVEGSCNECESFV